MQSPKKGEEFDPFAPNPVGFRWFKGVTLFTAAVSRIPDRGVYLAVFKVCSTPTGFKIMVNEHNRVMIPIMSRLMNEPGRYRFAYLRALRILLLVTMPIVCFCIAMISR